jgi:hypothetical protein
MKLKRMPVEKDSMLRSTPTTAAMPTTMTKEVQKRCLSVLSCRRVTVSSWRKKLI